MIALCITHISSGEDNWIIQFGQTEDTTGLKKGGEYHDSLGKTIKSQLYSIYVHCLLFEKEILILQHLSLRPGLNPEINSFMWTGKRSSNHSRALSVPQSCVGPAPPYTRRQYCTLVKGADSGGFQGWIPSLLLLWSCWLFKVFSISIFFF